MKNPFWKDLFSKNVFSRLLDFMVCNLLTIAVGFAAVLTTGFFAGILIQKGAENRFWSDLAFDLGMTAGFVFSFYFKFFVGNKEYRRFYLKRTEGEYSIRSLLKEHITTFSRYELVILLVVSLIPAVVPAEVMGKTGLSFLFGSASFFVDFIPNYLLTGIPVLSQVIGVVCWDIYIVLLYFVCLRLAFRKWEKGRLSARNSRME